MKYKFIYIDDIRDREGSKCYWKDSKGIFHEDGSKIGKEKEYDSRQGAHKKDFKTNTAFQILTRMKFKVKSEDYDDVETYLKSKNQLVPNTEVTRYWIPNEVFIKQMEESGKWFEVVDDNRGEEVFQTLLAEANDRSGAELFETKDIKGTFWIRREKQNLDQSVTFNGDGTMTSNLVSDRYTSYHYAFEDAYRKYLKVDNDVWYKKTDEGKRKYEELVSNVSLKTAIRKEDGMKLGQLLKKKVA
jgi:hypothetical protein